MPKLSIITINRNNASGLHKTIESVLSQTLTNFEYIVIDGGSTDGSVEIIKHYTDRITYWVSEPDKGIYNAMNKGIKIATGEYLQFLNSGDWLSDNNILENIFRKTHYGDVLYGNCKLELKNGEIDEYHMPEKITLSYFYSGRSINHQSSFFKRTLFDGNLYDETFKIVSDWKYYFLLIFRGAVFEYLDLFVVYFDYTGVGSVLDDTHVKERNRCLNEAVPTHIRFDYEEFVPLKYWFENFEKSNYYVLRNKNRYYRKSIKIFLVILNTIDKIVNKIWNKNH